ncbi:MAG: hypothetical protein F4Y94_05955 [Chloroflexi bacterium]|nr:hypothetical protein [Chloroflexota bacterium]
MDIVHAAVDTLRDAVGPQSNWLGTSEIRSVDDSRNLSELMVLLGDRPVVPVRWLDGDAVGRLRRLAGEQELQQQERLRLEAALSARFLDGLPPSGDYRTTAQAIAIPPSDERSIRTVVGTDWKIRAGAEPATLAAQTTERREALDALYQASRAVAEFLPDLELRTLAEIDRALDLGQNIVELAPIPANWLTESALDQLERDAGAAQSLLEELTNNETSLREDFSDAIVGLVDEEMLIRYRTDYQGFWKRLGGSYRRDQRTLRGQLATPRKLSLHESLNAVGLAVDVKRQRAQWYGMSPDLEARFAARFRGRETDWERVSGRRRCQRAPFSAL